MSESVMVESAAPETPAPSAPVVDAAPSTPSAPRSTAEIAAALNSEPAEDGGPAEAVSATPEPEVILSPAAKFLQKEGHQLKKVDGRPVWLPVATVEKMLDRYKGEHETGWTSERTALTRERDEALTVLRQLQQAASADPQAFLRDLAQHDPRYAAFLERQAAAAPPPPPTDEPGPDVTLPDGSQTYSLDGLKKREAWLRAQMLQEVEKKLQPLTEREQRSQIEMRARETYQRTMQEAETWPMFGKLPADGSLEPFQQEVLAELRQDSARAAQAGVRPQMTLRQAYLEVYHRHQSPEKVRERLLAELQTAPKAPSLSPRAGEVTRKAGPRSTSEIAQDIARQLEAGA